MYLISTPFTLMCYWKHCKFWSCGPWNIILIKSSFLMEHPFKNKLRLLFHRDFLIFIFSTFLRHYYSPAYKITYSSIHTFNKYSILHNIFHWKQNQISKKIKRTCTTRFCNALHHNQSHKFLNITTKSLILDNKNIEFLSFHVHFPNIKNKF